MPIRLNTIYITVFYSLFIFSDFVSTKYITSFTTTMIAVLILLILIFNVSLTVIKKNSLFLSLSFFSVVIIGLLLSGGYLLSYWISGFFLVFYMYGLIRLTDNNIIGFLFNTRSIIISIVVIIFSQLFSYVVFFINQELLCSFVHCPPSYNTLPRLSGIYQEPLSLSVHLAALFLALKVSLESMNQRKIRIIFLFSFLTISLSQSIFGLILFSIIGVYFFSSNRLVPIIISSVLIYFNFDRIANVLSLQDSSLLVRYYLNLISFQIAQDNSILFGAGIHGYRDLYDAYNVHSSTQFYNSVINPPGFLFLFVAELGLIGVCLYLYFVYRVSNGVVMLMLLIFMVSITFGQLYSFGVFLIIISIRFISIKSSRQNQRI
jgi:hypothetical protein